MRNLDFYEFVAIIVPGVFLLVSLGVFWPDSPLAKILLPTEVSLVLVHLVGAYAAGHLVQGLGNIFDRMYWRLWKGMPTDWAFSNRNKTVFPNAIDECVALTGHHGGVEDLRTWQVILSRARARVYESNLTGRIHVFNGNYGMLRGLAVTVLLLMTFVWTSNLQIIVVYPVLALILFLSLYRMHHFGVLYARELHANISNLANQEHKSEH